MKYLLDGQESKRLKFRLLNRNDFGIWRDLFIAPGSAIYMGLDTATSAEEQCESWFQKSESRYENNTGGLNALISKATGEFIGQCGLLLQEIDGKEELEIGYSILPEYRNFGYASEAAQKCRDFAFENEFADYLISIIHVDNCASEKVAFRNGMTLLKQTIFWEMPVNVFQITRESWKNMK